MDILYTCEKYHKLRLAHFENKRIGCCIVYVYKSRSSSSNSSSISGSNFYFGY